jgi:RimJ/RimL family protein N-acetyltransferase
VLESLVIRMAGEADAVAIARLQLASYRAAYRDVLPAAFLAGFGTLEREQRWHASLTDPGRDTYIAADAAGRLVGFAEIGGCRDDDIGDEVTGELMALHIGEACWRQGVGRVLHARAAAGLAARGFTRATLWVLTANTRARAFYAAVGWAADGRARHQVLRGTDVHEVRYVTINSPAWPG